VPARFAGRLVTSVIDPTCSIVLEAEQAQDSIMRAVPRSAGVFAFRQYGRGQFDARYRSVGCGSGGVRLNLAHVAPEAARAMAFVTKVPGNPGLIIVNRSALRSALDTVRLLNRALCGLVAATLAGMAVAVYAPHAARLCLPAPSSVKALAARAFAAVGSLARFEIYKTLRRRGWRAPSNND
jgi:P-type Ca2+ transporter type 2C